MHGDVRIAEKDLAYYWTDRITPSSRHYRGSCGLGAFTSKGNNRVHRVDGAGRPHRSRDREEQERPGRAQERRQIQGFDTEEAGLEQVAQGPGRYPSEQHAYNS